MRYGCTLTSSCNVGGIAEVSNKFIEFQIGKVDTSSGIVLEDKAHAAVRCEVVLTDGLLEETRAYANKDNALSGDFGVFDHSGTIALLARAIAKYRFEGTLEMDDLLGKETFSYEALRAQTRQVAASGHATVLPAGADSFSSPNVSAALVGAVSGLGGTVYSHLVGVNADTNTARIPSCSGRELALGCYDALNILAKQYDACGAGEIFAWAHTVGLMQGGTVVSGTDEGGIMRDIFRSVRFGVPYGPICVKIDAVSPLPTPRVKNGFAKYVDGTLLQCAGAVAICDPLVMFEGEAYVTTLTSSYKMTDAEKEKYEADLLANEKMDPNEGVDGDAISLMSKLQMSFPSFMALYSKALSRIYGLEGGSNTVVQSALSALMSNVGKVKRHLRYKTVNPYFWIEPTGSTRFDVSGFPVTSAGIGRLASIDSEGTRPAFHGIEEQGDNGFSAAYKVKWGCARKHGMLQHLTAHAQDGLTNIKLRQVNSHKVCGIGVGAAGRERESLEKKLENSRGLEEYLWRRGTSSVIGPNEIVTPGARVGMVINYRKLGDGTSLKVDALHAPTPAEMTQAVTFSVSGLQAIGVKKDGPGPTVKAMRQRDIASRALDNARYAESRLVDLDLLMPISTQDEDFDEEKEEQTGGSAVEIANPETAEEKVGSDIAGEVLMPTATHGTNTAPRLINDSKGVDSKSGDRGTTPQGTTPVGT